MMIVSVDGLGGTYYIYIYILCIYILYIMYLSIYIYICYNYLVSLVKKLASPKIQESPNRKSPESLPLQSCQPSLQSQDANAAVSNLGFKSLGPTNGVCKFII